MIVYITLQYNHNNINKSLEQLNVNCLIKIKVIFICDVNIFFYHLIK